MKLIVINGPNMNLTGSRDPAHYGSETLSEINIYIEKFAAGIGIEVDFFQSNGEGQIIDALHGAAGKYDGVIINPAAYTHYSYAIRDAIDAIAIPCVEVHMSNIFGREDFRARSVTAPVCAGMLAGFGKRTYTLAIEALQHILTEDCES